MGISSYNKFSRKFNAEISNLSFVKLADLYNEAPQKEYVITGIFVNRKSKFGDRPYLSTPDFLVDLPSNMLNTIEDMIDDTEVVKAVNDGKAGFKVVTYPSRKYNKQCFTVEFKDL